jgi:hypothetical protein
MRTAEKDSIPEKIIYANDSLFYLGGRSTCLEFMIDPKNEWVGTFENSGLGPYHVSSWLFSVNKEIFLSKCFSEFWRRYMPINNKYHAIHAGEHGLTKTLLRAGYRPTIIYSYGFIYSYLEHRMGKDFFSGYNLLSTELTNLINGIWGSAAFDINDKIYKIKDNLFLVSPMHVCQLPMIDDGVYDFIKKDLFWNERFSYGKLPYLENILSARLSKNEVNGIMTYYLARGRLRDAPLKTRMMVRLGIMS